jgi:predicted ferric reductase
VQVLDDDAGQAAMLRISVQTSLKWSPGQHVFLRFPKLAILDNHPFTIASVMRKPSEKEDSESSQNELLFLVRPYTGVTKRLLQHANAQERPDSIVQDMSSTTSPLRIKAVESHHVSIDGPYGGLEQHRAMHRLYDHVILVAGGSGISAMLPWLNSLSQRIADLDEPCRAQRVDLIWCVRHASARAWIEQELRECLRLAGHRVHVDVYVTDGKPGDISSSESASDDESPNELEVDMESKEKEAETIRRVRSDHDRAASVHAGRPYLPSLLPSLVSHRRTIILGCGPESLKVDLSNAAAKLQSNVLQNEADEVVLHTETFGW